MSHPMNLRQQKRKRTQTTFMDLTQEAKRPKKPKKMVSAAPPNVKPPGAIALQAQPAHIADKCPSKRSTKRRQGKPISPINYKPLSSLAVIGNLGMRPPSASRNTGKEEVRHVHSFLGAGFSEDHVDQPDWVVVQFRGSDEVVVVPLAELNAVDDEGQPSTHGDANSSGISLPLSSTIHQPVEDSIVARNEIPSMGSLPSSSISHSSAGQSSNATSSISSAPPLPSSSTVHQHARSSFHEGEVARGTCINYAPPVSSQELQTVKKDLHKMKKTIELIEANIMAILNGHDDDRDWQSFGHYAIVGLDQLVVERHAAITERMELRRQYTMLLTQPTVHVAPHKEVTKVDEEHLLEEA